MAGQREYDENRFKELVLYIAWRTKDEQDFGPIKLAKTLFYSDLAAYAESGQALTGARYEHWQHGPFPPALYPVRDRLVAEGIAHVEGAEERLIVPEKPDAPHFEGHPVVEHYIRKFAEMDPWEVRNDSHQHPGWWITGDREEIPYHVVFMSRRKPTQDDLDRGEQLARAHRWP